MRRGRWSEERACRDLQEVLSAISGEEDVMSGDVVCVLILYGLRVGLSGSLCIMCESSCCRIASPRGLGA